MSKRQKVSAPLGVPVVPVDPDLSWYVESPGLLMVQTSPGGGWVDAGLLTAVTSHAVRGTFTLETLSAPALFAAGWVVWFFAVAVASSKGHFFKGALCSGCKLTLNAAACEVERLPGSPKRSVASLLPLLDKFVKKARDFMKTTAAVRFLTGGWRTFGVFRKI